jgi:dCMP deaminase
MCEHGHDWSPRWDAKFLGLAVFMASWSKDPSTKVGAVIADHRYRVLSLGYNGFPRGIADTEERLNDRPTKYSLIAHAERNALDQLEASAVGATIYATLFPCSECAKSIVQRGIRRVVTQPFDADCPRWGESFRMTRAMFSEAGVEIVITTPHPYTPPF